MKLRLLAALIVGAAAMAPAAFAGNSLTVNPSSPTTSTGVFFTVTGSGNRDFLAVEVSCDNGYATRIYAATTLFKYYNPSDPLRKIMVAPGIDFLLNFESATTFDATTPQTVIDDGRDALFGDVGNDWLVGGTNEDHLYGGYGNDLLQADDNLDSTKVAGTVTYASLKALALSFATDRTKALSVTSELDEAQIGNRLTELQEFADKAIQEIGDIFTADQAATLQRLSTALGANDPLANNTPDPRSTGPTYADIAVGGAGRDVLIANTSADRLFDWVGEFNTYVQPWSGQDGPAISKSPDSNAQEFLTLLGLADGADPTRGGDLTRNGEPYGELGLVNEHDADWQAQNGPGRDPDLHLNGHADTGVLGFTLVAGPSADLLIQPKLPGLDSYSTALLQRILVRGQLAPTEESALGSAGTTALGRLMSGGYVSRVNGVIKPTDFLFLQIGYADPPKITKPGDTTLTGTSVVLTVSGTGDAGDTIKLYDGTTLVGTATVASDGTWTIVVALGVGTHNLTATQTVNALPHAGLTSAASKAVKVTVKAS